MLSGRFSYCVRVRVCVRILCSVDCVGILKLRNADVEARIGVAGSKKKSTRARLAFRVNIPRPDGSILTLQTTSSPILCSESVAAQLHFLPPPFTEFISITVNTTPLQSLISPLPSD